MGRTYLEQGIAYIADGAFDSAVESLQKAKDIDPDNKTLWTNLGCAYYWINKYNESANCCQRIIVIDPDDKYAYINLGNSYYRMEEYNKAISPFIEVRKLHPKCEKILYYLARTYFKMGNVGPAKQTAEKVLRIIPTHQATHKLLRKIEGIFPASMSMIPAGRFLMGSNDSESKDREKPAHTVYIDAFYMGICPVTNADYKNFVDANPEWQKGKIQQVLHDGNYLKHWNENDYPSGKGDHPVVYVSWYAAMAYAWWSGMRLPTEAEWEKAARGGLEGEKYPWGNSNNTRKANYNSNSVIRKETTPVKKYPMNDYGLYDMAGNVWEWCLDMYDIYEISSNWNPIAGANSTDEILNNFTNVKTHPPFARRFLSRSGTVLAVC